MILRRRCRSNIRIGFAVKNTMIKPTCRRTEDIIGSSLYITPIVILPAILIPCKQCILISQQPTITNSHTVSFYMQCYGLPDSSRPILYRKIFQRYTIPPYLSGISTKCPHPAQRSIIIIINQSLLRTVTF